MILSGDGLNGANTLHSCAGAWLQEFTDLRDKINTLKLEFSMIREVIAELDVRIPQTGRDYPVPKISERALARMEREAALAGQHLIWCPTLLHHETKKKKLMNYPRSLELSKLRPMQHTQSNTPCLLTCMHAM